MHYRRALLTIAAVALMALTFKLALWQFDRAEQKRQLESAAAAAIRAAAITLSQPQPISRFQRTAVLGQYLPAEEVLLENRVYQRQLGYYVLTPFALADGGAVMINRGWIAADGSRQPPAVAPPPRGAVTVRGVFNIDGADAYRLSSAPEQGRLRQHLDISVYAEQTGLPLLSLILIDEDGDDALRAVPLRTDYKSAQSTIYAWQWLTFCLLTAVFYLLLVFRKK